MTVSSETYQVQYNGNGVTVEFAIPFYFLDDSHIKAILYNTVDGETILTIVDDYALTGEEDPAGGTLTMVVAPATGEILTIVRDVSLTQETDYIEHSSFPADSHERALDKLTMIVQQQAEAISRTLHVSVTSSVSGELPTPSAGSALLWNADEDGFENSEVDINALATAVAGVTAAQTAAEAAQTAAEAAQLAAETAEIDAEAAEILAEKWAEETEDVEVEVGKYSAKHWAAKAEEVVGINTGVAIGDVVALVDADGGGTPGFPAVDGSLLTGISGIPAGLIAMWSGAILDIPAGWVLCDGLNGTPDLQDRFIVGAGDTYAVDAIGDGSIPSHTHTGPSHTHTGPSHTHTGPSHTHAQGTLATNSTGAHTHAFCSTLGLITGAAAVEAPTTTHNTTNVTTTSSGAHSHSISGATGAEGTGATGAEGTGATGADGTGASGAYGSGTIVVAKYYALAYIMKT